MNPKRLLSKLALALLLASVPAFGQNATLRLVASSGTIEAGQQVTVEAYISDLPIALHGYQIGLEITGGAFGQITAATFEDAVTVDFSKPDWIFKDVFNEPMDVLAAGDARFPPRLFALIWETSVGVMPTGEHYAGTFVLEASEDARGAFRIGIAEANVEDPSAQTILLAVGATTFPADVDDPFVIPVTSNITQLSVLGPPPIPAASTWGLGVLGLLLFTAATIVLRMRRAPRAVTA